jgi:D-xylulose reductase
MGHPEVVVPITALLTKELTLKSSFRYGVCTWLHAFLQSGSHKKKPGDYRLAIALTAKKMVNLRPLVTHRYAAKVRAWFHTSS